MTRNLKPSTRAAGKNGDQISNLIEGEVCLTTERDNLRNDQNIEERFQDIALEVSEVLIY